MSQIIYGRISVQCKTYSVFFKSRLRRYPYDWCMAYLRTKFTYIYFWTCVDGSHFYTTRWHIYWKLPIFIFGKEWAISQGGISIIFMWMKTTSIVRDKHTVYFIWLRRDTSTLCILPWTFVSSMRTHLTFRSGKMDTIWEVDSVSVVDNISIRIPGQAENMIRLYNNGNMSNKSLQTTTLDYPLGRIVLKPCSSLQWMLVSPSHLHLSFIDFEYILRQEDHRRNTQWLYMYWDMCTYH